MLFRSYQEFASGVESAASLSSTLSRSNVSVPPLLQFSGLLLDGMRHYFARRFTEANHTFHLIGPVKHASTSIPTLVTCAFFECLSLLADCPRFSLREYPDAVAATVAPDAGLPVLMPDDYDANDVMRRLARVDALIASMVSQALSAGDGPALAAPGSFVAHARLRCSHACLILVDDVTACRCLRSPCGPRTTRPTTSTNWI